MSKIDAKQQTVEKTLCSSNKYIIPDYQRPYKWSTERCETLWEDFKDFIFPDNNVDDFREDSEYYLGPIVGYINDNKEFEVIDGQQRLTTLLLLFRAFYSHLESYTMKSGLLSNVRRNLEKAIWEVDKYSQEPNKDKLKIDSRVATDDDKQDFIEILKNGKVPKESKSNYAKNFEFFQEKVEVLAREIPHGSDAFMKFPIRIMENVIILSVEANDWDSSLQIFNTLNDRGAPLADSDIFKSKLYRFYSDKGEQEKFINRWRVVEDACFDIFAGSRLSSYVDEVFTRYMYFLRAQTKEARKTSTIALRRFYEKNKYEKLLDEKTFADIEALTTFWSHIKNRNDDYFSKENLDKLFILSYAPNGMWENILSVYFIQNKDEDNKLDQKKLATFLNKISTFTLAYHFMKPGVNALKPPAYAEMVNIVDNKSIGFNEYKIDEQLLRDKIKNEIFTNQRMITKSILIWWMMQNKESDSKDFYNKDGSTVKLEIEHIYAKKRQEFEKGLKNENILESLGNKAILEKGINIKASDYRFEDKKKYYLGEWKDKEKTKNPELVNLAKNKEDFTEEDIEKRTGQIFDAFIESLRELDLLK